MVKRRFTDEDDDEPLVEMSEPVMQDVPEDLAESDSDDDASPEDVSNAAVREAALERDIGIKESQIKQRAALKAKRRDLADRLQQQSETRKARIAAATPLSVELLNAAKDLLAAEESRSPQDHPTNEANDAPKKNMGKHTRLDLNSTADEPKSRPLRKSVKRGSFEVVPLSTQRSSRVPGGASTSDASAFKNRAFLGNSRVKRVPVLTNLSLNKRRSGPAPFFTASAMTRAPSRRQATVTSK